MFALRFENVCVIVELYGTCLIEHMSLALFLGGTRKCGFHGDTVPEEGVQHVMVFLLEHLVL